LTWIFSTSHWDSKNSYNNICTRLRGIISIQIGVHVTPLIFLTLGIKRDSPVHARTRSTQGTVSPKELARPEEGLTGLFLEKWTAIRPQAVSNCQWNPTHVHQLEQPAGLLCSFKVIKSLSTCDCMSGQSKTKANRCDSYEKHLANIWKLPHGWSREGAKQPKTCEKHGGTLRPHEE
jgi:hypothetical protein